METRLSVSHYWVETLIYISSYSFKYIRNFYHIDTFLHVEGPRKRVAQQRRKRPGMLGPVVRERVIGPNLAKGDFLAN